VWVRMVCANAQRLVGGLVCRAHRLLYHSSLDLRVVKEKMKDGVRSGFWVLGKALDGVGFMEPGGLMRGEKGGVDRRAL
jgi:hypothetical protein